MVMLIGVLRLKADGGDAEAGVALARVRAAEAALARLDELEGENWILPDTAERTRGLYRSRISRFKARTDPDGDGRLGRRSLKYQRLRRELLQVERQTVGELRNTGEISDALLHQLGRDLDLEFERLDA